MAVTRLAAAVFLLLGWLAAAQPSAAQEEILSFVSTIEMSGEDRLLVTEDIEVMAYGAAIKRGIYRDFPTVFLDENGFRRQVGFTVVGIERNGAEEPWFANRNAEGVRIYIGSEDVFLPTGRHRYRITYETTRQIRRMADRDELYWNVTGNEWSFPILRAEARILLPEGVRPIDISAYTGAFGAAGGDYAVDNRGTGGEVVIRTTRPMMTGHGLTISVSLPAGTIAAPTDADRLAYFLLDYRSEVIGGAGALFVLLYYLFFWARYGRDPQRGTIIPMFDGPKDVSPALASYIHNYGFSGGGWPAFSASTVALAVRGLIVIDNSGDDPKLTRTEKPRPPNLPKGEAAILAFVDSRGGYALMNTAIGKQIETLGSTFRSAVTSESREAFFHRNTGVVVMGVVLSVLTMVLVFWLGLPGPEQLILLLPMTVLPLFVTVLVIAFRSLRRGRGGILDSVFGIVRVLFALFAIAGVLAVLGTAAVLDSVSLPLATVAFALVALNILFFFLMSAPTVVGRQVMDHLEGLELYLTVADKVRLNQPDMPPVTPTRYETLLPYAMALGVEKPWSEALEAQLARTAGAAAAAYHPGWYHGDLHRDRFARDITSGLSSMNSSFVSALPAPKSSSSGSGGGGSSGGGGGGGGGGGW